MIRGVTGMQRLSPLKAGPYHLRQSSEGVVMGTVISALQMPCQEASCKAEE